MGQDLRAIVPHRLKPDRILNLRETLNSYNKNLLKLFPEAYLDPKERIDEKKIDVKSSNDEWLWFGGQPETDVDIFETWDKSDIIELAGPGSLFISFGKQCAIIGSWIRWRRFCTDPKIFNGWRAIVRSFTGFLKASNAIYVPDSGSGKNAAAENYVFTGDSFETVKNFLLEHCGPPLTSIDTIKELTGDIYFYDDFGIKEYDVEAVLTKYIWDNYREFITQWEHKVNTAIIMNWKAEAYGNPAYGWKYHKHLGEDFKNDIKAHEEIQNPDAFRKKVRDRVLTEHGKEVFVNKCAKCNKIVRTPTAKQCFWCGYDWH